MSVNPGIFSGIVTAITHSQRMNRHNNDTKENTTKINKVMIDYQPVSSSKEILEALKKLLEQERCKDEDSISIYELLNLTRKKYQECKLLDRNLCWDIKRLTEKNSLFLDVDFDCENKQLIISYHCDKIFFTKQDGDLIIVKSEYWDAEDILGKCGKEISERYDKFIENISFYEDYINDIKATNCNFIINSDEYVISISENFEFESSFNLSARIYNDEYKYNCNSNNITMVCRNNEDEIFKRIFIKISDCPKWTHETLYKIRNLQLEQQEKIEYKEMKKQKRLELVRKLNPFRKK